MGNEFEIYVYKELQPGNYDYVEYWVGDDYYQALEQLELARSAGYGCIKLEWRPAHEV